MQVQGTNRIHSPQSINAPHFTAKTGQIWADWLPFSINHMTGRTLPFSKEKRLPDLGIAGDIAFSRRSIQGLYQGGQRFEFFGGQIERGHARAGNAIANQVPQLLNGSRLDATTH